MAIELISKIKPKNNGNFKLVDVQDVEYNGKGLDEAIASGEFKGDKGDRGDIGPIGPTGPTGSTGPKGDNGDDGFSPTVSVAEEADGVTVTVQNKDGAQTAKVKNGKDGKDYEHSEEFTTLAEQVRADKESVEQSKTSVEQTVAQAEGKIDTAGTIAIQGVQNEGTTQTEKVTVEGTKQITEIQSKGEEILHSFPQDFPTQMATKLDKQQGTEHAGKALVIGEDGLVVPGEVQSGGDGITIVNTASGKSPLVIPDSAERVNKGFGLTGKTEQVQTTGKNLFDGKILAGKYPTDDMNIYEDKTTTNIFDKPVEIKPDTEYIISADGRLVEGNIYIYDEAGKKITEHYSGKFTSPSNAKYVVASGSNTYMTVKSAVQMEYGSTITPYEPYTGGKPSPSPEYPQEIKNSGKWNEEKQKYEVDVKIIGKNLFDVNYFTKNENYQNKDGDATYWKIAKMKVKPNTSYMLSKSKSVTVNGAINSVISYAGALGFNNNDNSVKVTTNDTGILYIMFFYRNEDVNILKELDIQVELGETLTEYEPYKEQTLTLTSDRPITKWDRLVEQGGQIGWLYGSNTVVIDGSETWSSSNVPEHMCFTTVVNNKSGRINTSLCKTYKNNGEPVFNKKHEGEYNIYSDHPTNGVSDTAFVPPNETVTTIPQWKEWLNANPIEMLYKTKTTEFIPLPQPEQNAIRALKTYYPTTVITADGGELDPDIEVTYTADTKNYIDNKFAQLQKSLINTQVQLL